jgi:hypothetical protein
LTTPAHVDHLGITAERARQELKLAGGYNHRRPALWELSAKDAKQIAQMVVYS